MGRGIDELQNRIKNVELAIAKEHKELNKEIAEQQEEMGQVTQNNTELLKKLDELNRIQSNFVRDLNIREQGEIKMGVQLREPEKYMTGSGDIAASKSEGQETEELEQMIAMQNNKKNLLIAEIEVLSRKGGSVAPPR